MSELAAALCVRILREFNTLQATPQDESKASYCTKIKKDDGLVNLDNAKELYQKFLAFYPWPGVFLENGLKFMDIEIVENLAFGGENSKAGQILAVENSHFLLACKKGVLKIKALQEAGKKIVNARAYINGKRLKVGDSLC